MAAKGQVEDQRRVLALFGRPELSRALDDQRRSRYMVALTMRTLHILRAEFADTITEL